MACAPSFFGAGVTPASAHDGGVNHHVLVVVIAAKNLKTRSKTPLLPIG